VKRLTFPHARACCEFDEFSYDIPHNQILKSTLRTLSRCDLVGADNRHALHLTHRRLPEIADIVVNDGVFRTVQLHRNNRFYYFLLEICRIISNNLLINENTGESQFRDFVRDPKSMARLFEKFVRNFYRREQSHFSVSAERFPWQATTATDEDLELLPTMLTDISLRNQSQHLVFDTKFYPEAFREHHGRKRLRSGHIYQLFAYMQNLAIRHGPDRRVDGALLYPAVHDQIDLRYEMHGQTLCVCSINLDQDWSQIKTELLRLLNKFSQK
jgi:5-methylcytosine-specific restriction enzyme subunit McrC